MVDCARYSVLAASFCISAMTLARAHKRANLRQKMQKSSNRENEILNCKFVYVEKAESGNSRQENYQNYLWARKNNKKKVTASSFVRQALNYFHVFSVLLHRGHELYF